jgi:hypothetical protein
VAIRSRIKTKPFGADIRTLFECNATSRKVNGRKKKTSPNVAQCSKRGTSMLDARKAPADDWTGVHAFEEAIHD